MFLDVFVFGNQSTKTQRVCKPPGPTKGLEPRTSLQWSDSTIHGQIWTEANTFFFNVPEKMNLFMQLNHPYNLLPNACGCLTDISPAIMPHSSAPIVWFNAINRSCFTFSSSHLGRESVLLKQNRPRSFFPCFWPLLALRSCEHISSTHEVGPEHLSVNSEHSFVCSMRRDEICVSRCLPQVWRWHGGFCQCSCAGNEFYESSKSEPKQLSCKTYNKTNELQKTKMLCKAQRGCRVT